MIRQLILVALAAWFFGWWGHYMGMQTWKQTELASIERDLTFLEVTIDAINERENCIEVSKVEILRDLKQVDRGLLSNSMSWSLGHLLIHPITGPFELAELKQLRRAIEADR